MRLIGSQKDQQTTEQVDTQGGQDHTDQGHGQSNPDPQDPAASYGSTLGQASFSGINLIPFMPIEGEEVPEFSTIFSDKEKKRIVKITEKKVETGGQSRKMITDRTLVHGTNTDPRLIARAGVALTEATKDNIDRLMMNLEQSRKNVAQLKETLKKERDEGQKLKSKYEDMMNEVKTSRT